MNEVVAIAPETAFIILLARCLRRGTDDTVLS